MYTEMWLSQGPSLKDLQLIGGAAVVLYHFAKLRLLIKLCYACHH